MIDGDIRAGLAEADSAQLTPWDDVRRELGLTNADLLDRARRNTPPAEQGDSPVEVRLFEEDGDE